jgi:hypothetical protein
MCPILASQIPNSSRTASKGKGKGRNLLPVSNTEMWVMISIMTEEIASVKRRLAMTVWILKY